jgi:hypothetical protein
METHILTKFRLNCSSYRLFWMHLQKLFLVSPWMLRPKNLQGTVLERK